MPADLILYNAKIATNGNPSFVEAIAVTEGKISAYHDPVRLDVRNVVEHQS
jgi:predicted amidohydrolase YtcJ